VGREWIPWLALLLVLFGGCSKDKKPRYTAVAIMGYPFPFGVNVKHLIGRSRWNVTSNECRTPYYNYHVSGSQWSDYSEVVLTADSLGTLQAFSATRLFSDASEGQSYLTDISEEIWRRYGAQSDSAKVNKNILGRMWRDQSGNVVSVYAEGGGVKVKAVSGRIEHDCPSLLGKLLPQPKH